MKSPEYYRQQEKIRQRLLSQIRKGNLDFLIEDCQVWGKWHLFSNPQVTCSQRMYTWERNIYGKVFCKRTTI